MTYSLIRLIPSSIRTKTIGDNTLQEIVTNSGWLLADRFLRMGVGMFVSVWIVRYLGPEKFGLFSYAQSFTALFGALAGLGLGTIVIRDLVTHQLSNYEILGTTFVIQLCGGFVAVLLSTFAIIALRPDEVLTQWLVVIIATGNIFLAFNSIEYWFKSKVQTKYAILGKDTAYLVIVLSKIGLILAGAPLVMFAWATLAEATLSAVALLVVYRFKDQYISQWTFKQSWAKTLLKDSWPLFLAYLSYIIYTKIDQVMIGDMLGNYQVGIYSASTKIYQLLSMLVLVLSSSLFPPLVKLYQSSDTEFYSLYSKLTALFTGFGFVLFLTVLIFGGYAITLIYGNEFLDATSIFQIQVFGMIFIYNAGLRSSFLAISNNQKIIFITTAVTAVVNIGLNFWLIPIYEMEGAAYATVFSQFISLFLLNLFFNETRKIFFIQLKSLSGISIIQQISNLSFYYLKR